MSGIIKRTALLDCCNSRGCLIMHDYCLVLTGLGTMVEPGAPFQRIPRETKATGYDPTDMIARVDEFMSVALGKEQSIFAFGGPTNLHGGSLAPRTGW